MAHSGAVDPGCAIAPIHAVVPSGSGWALRPTNTVGAVFAVRAVRPGDTWTSRSALVPRVTLISVVTVTAIRTRGTLNAGGSLKSWSSVITGVARHTCNVVDTSGYHVQRCQCM